MADVKQTGTAQDFVVSVGQTLIQTDEQALSVYYQMRSYPELQKLLDLHTSEITKAIQSGDTNVLINILQKAQSDFLRGLSEQPYQIQLDTERKMKDAQPTEDELSLHVDNAKQALGKTYKAAETVYDTKRKQNQEFIEKLVKNYSKLTPAESTALSNAIIATAETYPELSSKEIIQAAARTTPQVPEESIRELQKQKTIQSPIIASQKNNITTIEQQIIQAVLESDNPLVTVSAIKTYGAETNKNTTELPAIIKQAQTLATAHTAVQSFESQSNMDYAGFFSQVSKNGSLVEKMLAPLADTALSLFPQKTQEAVVLKVLGSSWNKEISNNTWMQQTFGTLLQSSPVQQAITKGNALFQSGGKNAVFTKTQSFFADVFVTVFHPQVSEVYIQLAGLGSSQMGTSAATYYAGWLAGQGATAVAKKGAKVVGKKVVEKAGGAAIGKVIGGLLGSEGGPVGAAIGAFIFDKLLGGLWRGTKKLFGALTLDWLGKLMSGQYESGSVLKDPTFIIAAVLVGAVVLLFIAPFLIPLSLGGSAVFQKTVQNSAYVSGIGGITSTTQAGINTGAGFSCSWSGPTPPTTSISYCPVRAPITQGPNTQIGTSHYQAQAYDFGCNDGTPIHASHDGYITSVVTTFQPNEYKYASFGNNVVLVGTDASGKTFCTIYAHFLDVTPAVISAYQNQTLIHAGEVLGYSDTTGYTYGSQGLGKGPHLHFGYKGSGTLSLPSGCP
ncbi:MAG: peptidoglycan DD-metalloendopeptidase family protein [Microgenomates group bacterium]